MSNTKTRRNIFLAVIAVVVVAVLLLAGTVFLTHNFIWYEKGYHPDPDSWVGLTKGEFLDLAFKEFPACRGGELYVIVKETTPKERKTMITILSSRPKTQKRIPVL